MLPDVSTRPIRTLNAFRRLVLAEMPTRGTARFQGVRQSLWPVVCNRAGEFLPPSEDKPLPLGGSVLRKLPRSVPACQSKETGLYEW